MPLCLKCQNQVRKGAKFCHWCGEASKRVGVFVDYENFMWIKWQHDSEISPKRKGEVLSNSADRYGYVVCRWICAHPRNVPDWPIVKQELVQAGFSIKYPAGVKTEGLDLAYPQQADHALIRLLYEESLRSQPDIYVLVTGDADYYEHIESLIEQGHSVHLWASKNHRHLAGKYYKLQEKYRPGSSAQAGKGLFTIDNLDNIFRSQGIRPIERLSGDAGRPYKQPRQTAS